MAVVKLHRPKLTGVIIGIGALVLVVVTGAVIWVAKVSEERPKILRA